jgi:hypothetical protein
MRMLKGGQMLVLAGTSEALQNCTTSKELLQTILHHTADMIQMGVETHFQRGMQYHHFPNQSIDDFNLRSMYSGLRSRYPTFAAYFDATFEVSKLSEAEIKLAEYCKDLGDIQVDTGMLSGECEQELEHEAENEVEQETEKPREEPAGQTDWDYVKAFTDPNALIASGVFVSLRSFCADRLPKIAGIDWDAHIFCSTNFCNTIVRSYNDLSPFARHVSAMLVTHDNRVLLLSLYETDKLLPRWWKCQEEWSSTRPRPATLRHLFLADDRVGFGRGDDDKLPPKVLASVKLFRGHVGFFSSSDDNDRQQMDHVREAFGHIPEPRAVALDLLHMRHRLGYYDRSDLELATTTTGPASGDERDSAEEWVQIADSAC